MASMNVVPPIDILLLLLIIFMVIPALRSKGLEAQVPQLSHKAIPRAPGKVVLVQVSENHHLKINDDAATRDNLGQKLNPIFRLRAKKVVFGVTARAMDVMRRSGVKKVGLMTARIEVGE